MKSIGIFYDVAYPFIKGGGQKRLYEVAIRLKKNGWEVYWYTIKTWAGEERTNVDGIHYVAVQKDVKLYHNSGRRSISEALLYAMGLFLNRRKILKHDVYWCGQWPYFHIYALWWMGRLRHAVLWVDWWETWRSQWRDYLGVLGLAGRFIEWFTAKVAAHKGILITPGMQARADVVALGVPDGKVVSIDNGIDWPFIQGVQGGGVDGDIIVLGRLKDHKNIDHVLHAVCLLKERGTPVSLTIIGDGPEGERLEQLSKELRIEEQTQFLGEVRSEEEKFQTLKSHKVFVHPSTKEGGGSVTLLEANACGLPAVGYRHPNGIDPNLVNENLTGILVSCIAPSALADAIWDILDRWDISKTREVCIEWSAKYDWQFASAGYESLTPYGEASHKRSPS